MADTKITALAAIGANPINVATFPIPMVDLLDTSMAASGTTKKVTVNQILGAGGTATLASATITGDLTVDTSTLKVDSANNRVGIGIATPQDTFNVKTGTFDISSVGGNYVNLKSWTGTAGGPADPIFAGGRISSTSTGAGGALIFATDAATNQLVTAVGTERYRIASDGVATWSNVGGVAGTAMTLNSTGLGVGMSPSASLSVLKSSATQATGLILRNANGTDGSSISLDFETSAGTSGLESSLAGRISGRRTGSGTTGALDFFVNNLGTLGSAKMTLDANGYLLIGTTDTAFTSGAGYKFGPGATPSSGQVGASSSNGDLTYRLYSTGAAAYRFYVGFGGTVFATNTTISAISDARLKENVQDIDVGLGAILALKPRKFDWKDGKGKDIKGDRGFIAQEFEQVFPQLVDQWADEAPEGEAPYKSVRQDLIPVLVKAIQELAARVQTLETR